MPVSPTYPGVYIQEVPSEVRTITGVATSITAFVGRALRGPVDEPVFLTSYSDFERIFGGLWLHGKLGFALRDFFTNGGSQALVVRLYHAEEGAEAAPPRAQITHDGLVLQAAHPGAWGNRLRIRVDDDVSAEVAERLGLEANQLFNLSLYDGNTGQVEVFRNLTAVESPRLVDKVVENRSQLMRVQTNPATVPTAHSNPDAGTSEWDSDSSSSGVAEADEASDGEGLEADDFIGDGLEAAKEGLFALRKADLFNLLCIPPYDVNDDIEDAVLTAAARLADESRALLIVDSPHDWDDVDAAIVGLPDISSAVGAFRKNAALFFPRLRQRNPLRDNQMEDFVSCGAVAGVFARTDSSRGVWKAPAGLDAALVGVPALSVGMTDPENGRLNPLGVNCLRTRPAAGRVIWGSRTLAGDDRLASEWKYIPVRRTALFIEESLYRGTQWVVFEPNDEPLWAQIRLNLGAFMHGLFRQGAFQGSSPRDAYFVKCDRETTTQNDINNGIVNIIVGFAPLKPAEFVIIKIQQIAGQLET
ncbi:MAG: phage tail sheath family protein [Puniceicoccaceae bacterium]|nr:MAG: phage tail sheath family protein [Puniceicoccaceae bacterium]